jgi:hypothetical protein
MAKTKVTKIKKGNKGGALAKALAAPLGGKK